LGGIYYALKDYDQAIRFFQQAVDVKPNFANGYYNLTAAYREKGDFVKAHEMMQITLSLVPPESEDYSKAKIELDELAKKISEKQASESTQPQIEPVIPEQSLLEPEPFPSPVITPPIELPEEQATPDISPAPAATQ
jgi:tetratricopeptide (TPR) repeat protein